MVEFYLPIERDPTIPHEEKLAHVINIHFLRLNIKNK